MSRPKITLGIAILACCSLVLFAVAADPKKPSKTEKKATEKLEPTPVEVVPEEAAVEAVEQEDRGPWEVTDQVELVFREKLAAAGQKTLSAKVQFKNKSENDIPGKLVLVVDGASIDGVRLHEPQGQFTETTPYLQMIPAKRTLEVGEETPVKTLILTSVQPSADLNLESATLRWRAFTLTKPADQADESTEDDKKVPGKDYTWGEMRKVMASQSNATIPLVEKHNGAILGTSTSENADGKLVIRVYAAQGGMSRKIPGEIDGIPVELTVTGTINGGPAMSRVISDDKGAKVPVAPEPEADNGPEADNTPARASGATPAAPLAGAQAGPTTRRFTRPVPIGISAFNQTDVCAAGTLGCRCVGRDGRFYALSNNHVFAEENLGTVGDAICQPGPLEYASCLRPITDIIGTLHDFQRIQFFTGMRNVAVAPVNIMDAAVAVCPAGMVDVCTPREGYGTPARLPQESLFVGMNVQKHGRTTSYTKGKVYGLNVEAVINYGAPGLARFRNCIDIQTQFRFPAFGGPGDSGSLVVTLSDRRPVGILFAGGGFDTFLCPISPVLHRFKVGVDDGTGAAPILGSGRMGSASGPVRQHQNVIVPLSK